MKSNVAYIPKAGDIVAWNNASKCTSIAIMMNEDEFSVCLNFRGRKDEESRLWQWDNVPTSATIRRADKFEMAWLFAELVAQGYEFAAKDGKVVIPIDFLCPSNNEAEEPEAEPKQPEVKVECVAMNRQQRFAKYVYELVELYKQQGNFRNMSDLSKRNNISSIKKELCFHVGLHQLRDKEWLKTAEGLSFCHNLYEYVLHHTTKYPLIPQSQR